MTEKKEETKTQDTVFGEEEVKVDKTPVEGAVPEVVDATDTNEFKPESVDPTFSKEELAAKIGSASSDAPETPVYPFSGVNVVEPDATVSGYVHTPAENPREQPYLVERESVLAQPPWNVAPGTVQGRSSNPPLTDDLRRELGLDDDSAESSKKSSKK